MSSNRIPKSFSFSSEGEYQQFLNILGDFAKQYPQLDASWGTKLNASTILKKIASNEVDLIYTGKTEIYEPLQEMVNNKQPFRITYADATGKKYGYTVLYAEFVQRMYGIGKMRTYMDCWCLESATNTEIVELQHNWTLRAYAENYKSAEIKPISGEVWRDKGMDAVNVELLFGGSLSWEYERSPEDIEDSGFGETRRLIKKVSSTDFLMRELALHAMCNPTSVKVVNPQSFCEKWMKNISSLI